MRYLLRFLIKYNYWFLFLFLELIAFGLLVRFNMYQRGAFFTSANVLVGNIYEVSGRVSSYFHLKADNEDLMERNMVLEQQISLLKQALNAYEPDSLVRVSNLNLLRNNFSLFKSRVINNSLNKADNYITLDKGSNDGVKPEMGVIDGRGVVGIVYLTSPSYSLVISLLNSKSSISCKIKSSDYFGYLRWEGMDSRFAYLKDLPRHAEFNLGDTVITSGHSAVFPEGLMVGVVDDMKDSNDGLSYNLKIKLAAEFGKLNNAWVISREGRKEQQDLEKEPFMEKNR